MPILDLVILALIQGITEFLPISSSGHLAAWPLVTGRADQGITLDVAVHLGTLVAVCIYFRADLAEITRGAVDILSGRPRTTAARQTWLLAIATVPAVIVGLAFKLTGAIDALRTLEVIGWATLIGGLVLWVADRFGGTERASRDWTLGDAILLGLAQAVALVPGTSRSGACMTMARSLGFSRSDGARLALVMAIPTIAAAGLVETVGLVRDGNLALGADFAIGAVLACAAAFAALGVMMRMFAADWTMTPFVTYRIALGIILLAIA